MAMSEAHAVVTVPMPSGHTIAVSRPPDGPLGYRACYPGAPERTTRAAAERDMCRHRQENR